MCAGPEKALGWYSDNLDIKLEISEQEFQTRAPEDIKKVPTDDLFLSEDHPWLVAMKEVRTQLSSFSG
jgi:hypothetical protein